MRDVMRTISTLVLALSTCMATLGVAAEHGPEREPNAQEILAASDAVRNPDKPFGLSIVLTEYRNAQEVNSNTLAIYSKLDGQTGRYRTLVSYRGPARDAGKLVLENGTEMWFYDPSSQASIRISPQQRLIGQASTGDVVTVNFAHDYRASTAAA